jgi:hypothetical protein
MSYNPNIIIVRLLKTSDGLGTTVFLLLREELLLFKLLFDLALVEGDFIG